MSASCKRPPSYSRGFALSRQRGVSALLNDDNDRNNEQRRFLSVNFSFRRDSMAAKCMPK